MFYVSLLLAHHPRMKFFLSWLGLCLVALTFTSCGTKSAGPGPSMATGPFDKNGNYVEAWADSPSKWKKGRITTPSAEDTPDIPQVASNDQPPENSVPISTSSTSSSSSSSGRKEPVVVATRTKSAATRTTPKAEETVKRTVRHDDDEEDRPRATTTKAKPKPKTEAVKVKPKVKPKPKTTRVVVKKGDTLSAIASRNGTSVGALQRANGISGSVIRPGQSLVIPK